MRKNLFLHHRRGTCFFEVRFLNQLQSFEDLPALGSGNLEGGKNDLVAARLEALSARVRALVANTGVAARSAELNIDAGRAAFMARITDLSGEAEVAA